MTVTGASTTSNLPSTSPPPTPWMKTCFALFGGLGAGVAVLGDVMQKGPASAVLKIAQTMSLHLQVDLAPVIWALILIVIGVLLTFVAEARTNKTGFAAGAGVLAILVTWVPVGAPQPPPGGTESGNGQPSPGAFLDLPAHITFVASARAAERKLSAAWKELEVKFLAPEEGPEAALRLRIVDPQSKQHWDYTTWIAPGGRSSEVLRLPAGSGSEGYVLELEAEGYRKERIVVAPDLDQQEIRLDPYSRPLWIQRLFKAPSYNLN